MKNSVVKLTVESRIFTTVAYAYFTLPLWMFAALNNCMAMTYNDNGYKFDYESNTYKIHIKILHTRFI